MGGPGAGDADGGLPDPILTLPQQLGGLVDEIYTGRMRGDTDKQCVANGAVYEAPGGRGPNPGRGGRAALVQVVAKLSEGRSKRMNFLNKQHKSAVKDIEQRSAETCAMSTTALETFQKKADMKREDAAKAWEHGMQALRGQIDDARK